MLNKRNSLANHINQLHTKVYNRIKKYTKVPLQRDKKHQIANRQKAPIVGVIRARSNIRARKE